MVSALDSGSSGSGSSHGRGHCDCVLGKTLDSYNALSPDKTMYGQKKNSLHLVIN